MTDRETAERRDMRFDAEAQESAEALSVLTQQRDEAFRLLGMLVDDCGMLVSGAATRAIHDQFLSLKAASTQAHPHE